MGLLAPWFLGALGVLALPLYLHLLKRHKSVPQQFSSLMFFEKSLEANLKHRRLDYLLLLAVRMALLTLAVLAFAQPFLWRKGAAVGAAQRLVVLDDSASMGFGDRMAQARAEAARLMAPGAKLALFDSQLRMAPPGEAATAQAGTSRSSLGELARALRVYEQSLKRPLEVHLISDLQKSSMPGGFSELQLGPDTKLALHPVGEKTEPNWTVESVHAPSRVRDGKGVKVQATVAGFHTEAARKTVGLEVNGRIVARQTVEVPANGRVSVEFLGMDLPYGFSKCAVVLEEGDGLPVDDRYLFAVERTDPQRVLFLYGEKAARSAVYFRNALEAAAGGAYAVESLPVGQSGGVNPEQAAFVVLSDVGALDDAVLRRYVEKGGSALVVLGPASVAAGRVPVTGERIRASRMASLGAERYQGLGSVDEAYAAVAKADRWAGVRFYQVVDVMPGESRVVARLTDSTPVLLEERIGEGTVVTLASGLDNVSNDFPVRPAFVPFVEQMANRLSGWEEAALNVTVDTSFDFKGDFKGDFKSTAGSKAYEALDTDGKRALTLEESAKGVPLQLSRAGFWEVRRGAGKAQMIAANVDRRESDLEPMPKESAALWQSPVKEAGRAENAGLGGDVRWPVGAWILGAALLAALLEAVVAGRHLLIQRVHIQRETT